ncbi:MAG: ferritin-like domain-containing protein [Nannocystaceae bacterium]
MQERRADRPARWQCLGRACEVGRLLRVGDGPPRVAATRRGAGWRAASIDVAPVADAAHRAALAEHWREVALLEHASVASFARFTRQLLSLGAPITLVQEASAAMRDEIEHARLAFAVAAAYGDPSTPGTLDATRVTAGPPTRLEVARALIDEACVAETLGVAEALGAAEACEDPAIRDVLEAIAGDELRHAALAWRSLRWLLTTSAQAERRQIAASLQAALVDGARASSTAVAPGRDDPRRGLLGPRRRHELRRRALRQVIEPCARALLAAFAGDRPAAAPSVTCSIEHV